MLKDLATILPLQELTMIFPLLNLFGPNPQTIEEIVKARGGVDGGGGDAVVCRNLFGGIKSAEMLDVWEGKNHYKLSITESKIDYKIQVDDAIAKLPSEVDQMTTQYFVEHALQNLEFINRGTKLAKINDSYEIVVPKKCKIEQVAVFQADQKLLIDSEIWKKLSQTSRAALILHEALYLSNRMRGAKDSRQSRFDVSLMLSDFSAWEDTEKLIQAPGIYNFCFSEPDSRNHVSHVFEVKEIDENWLKLQFHVVNFNNVLSSKFAYLQKENFPLDRLKFNAESAGSSLFFTENLIQTELASDELTFAVNWDELPGSPSGYQIASILMGWKSGTHNALTPSEKIGCTTFQMEPISNNNE